MNDRQFTLVMSDSERLMVVTALGFVSMRLPAQSYPGDVIDCLIVKLSTASGSEPRSQPMPMGGTEVARAILERPPAPAFVDYFQPTKKGTPVTDPPEGAELSIVKIINVGKIKLDAKYWTVFFDAGTTAEGKTRPARKASCWDRTLVGMLTEGQAARLWIKASGNYLNIVGVRA